MSKMSEDVAVAKSRIIDLSKSFEEFKSDMKAYMRSVSEENDRQNAAIEAADRRSIANGQRISNMSIFQTSLSVITGAIATYIAWTFGGHKS